MKMFELIEEAVTDVPDGADAIEVLGIASARLDAAKKGLGIANTMKNPADKAKHRSRVMSNLNQIRALVARAMNVIDAEAESISM